MLGRQWACQVLFGTLYCLMRLQGLQPILVLRSDPGLLHQVFGKPRRLPVCTDCQLLGLLVACRALPALVLTSVSLHHCWQTQQIGHLSI